MSAKEAPPRLGRGLAALMGGSTEAIMGTTPKPSSLAIDQLEPGPYQPRGGIDPDSLSELVESIRVRGILQPLLARPHPTSPGRYQIIAGERRWRAAQRAGLSTVPALVRDLTDADAMAAGLVENLQRQDLNPIEEAEGYRRLRDEFKLSQESLADAVGKSRSHVANTLRLLALPPKVQAELRKGSLSAGHARALLAHPDPEKAAQAAIARQLNVRQTEALSAPRPTSGPTRQKDAETLALEHDLSEKLGLKVDINFDGKGGSLRIQYKSLDQLDGIIALLGRD